MKFEFEVFETDLEDRKKIIEMKEELNRRMLDLSKFGQNTMSDSMVRLLNNLEYAENEWLFCQRDKVVNKLSEMLNVDRKRFDEKYWHDD